MVPAHTLIAVLLALWVSVGEAHPFHASYAEVGWGPGGEQLEVALRVIPEDLENALSLHAGRRVLINPDEPPDEAIEDYLVGHFQVLGSQESGAELSLIGLEVAYDATWLYFTLAVPRSAAPLSLTNSVLFDVSEGQTNRVRQLWDPDAPLLVFTVAEPKQIFWVNE